MSRNRIRLASILFLVFFLSFTGQSAFADDSEVSRGTLKGLRGICVLVENIQPNIQKYAKKSGLDTDQLKQEIEQRLRASGIKVCSRTEWMNTPGRPVLYININTHETEKYWYAYDIKLELRQIVFLEANPKVRTLTGTWSMNMTGIANIGNLHIIKNDTIVLVDRFVGAYRSINK